MKALTETQQEIIDNLLKEFHGMNETNPIPFTLFNAQPILNEIKAKEINIQETKLHNKAMEDELLGRINDYVDILNNDFNNAGLFIKAKSMHTTIIIEADISKVGYNVDTRHNVNLYAIKIYDITKNNYSKTTAYLYANDTNTDNRFNTIEELLETTVFKSRIQELIERTITASKK